MTGTRRTYVGVALAVGTGLLLIGLLLAGVGAALSGAPYPWPDETEVPGGTWHRLEAGGTQLVWTDETVLVSCRARDAATGEPVPVGRGPGLHRASGQLGDWVTTHRVASPAAVEIRCHVPGGGAVQVQHEPRLGVLTESHPAVGAGLGLGGLGLVTMLLAAGFRPRRRG